MNDIHSDVSLRVRKVEVKDGWQGVGMMIMVGDGDDIYDGFVYIPWVIVSLGFPVPVPILRAAFSARYHVT